VKPLPGHWNGFSLTFPPVSHFPLYLKRRRSISLFLFLAQTEPSPPQNKFLEAALPLLTNNTFPSSVLPPPSLRERFSPSIFGGFYPDAFPPLHCVSQCFHSQFVPTSLEVEKGPLATETAGLNFKRSDSPLNSLVPFYKFPFRSVFVTR